MLQRPIPFEELLQIRFIGSYRGSTASELQKACEENGLEATPLSGLSSASLQSSEYPVILHVRRPGRKMPFMHWVLFAGAQNRQARIIDPPGKVELVSFSELSSLWDGIGIVVSTKSTTNFALKVTSLFEMFVLLICVGLFLCLLMLADSSKKRGGTLSFACLIPATGILAGLIYHACSSEGLFRNPSAVAQVRIQHFQPDISIIDGAELVCLISSNGVSIIDARTVADYRSGHIPTAVNLPIHSGLSERWRLRSAYSFLAFLFVVFIAVQSSAVYRGLHISCGCFGAGESLPVGPWTIAFSGFCSVASTVGFFVSPAKPIE
jgi:hypothetical protein